jgi:hypothetical protein
MANTRMKAPLKRGPALPREMLTNWRHKYRSLPEAIIFAAESAGSDNRGRDGLVGYLSRIARTNPKTFVGLLAKLPPNHFAGTEPECVRLTVDIFDDKHNLVKRLEDGECVYENDASSRRSDLE